ncbi:glucose-6-phosphate isomerase [Heliophilum fasciatum]|uniref:Glucose-6-phosphate isomerase n=1 Tax=Heliophilum fasciatum TaxID=35700 RepID=A0A4R2RFR0_9FIRM|nr:glucose-6-phosphate isomerase [Heliophilum fasciatum]MCW2279039.1 glucose-6-phosphate isomerase [Heliophilum fasciatum]TCP61504.1 glucose-6-phosphate isomerase [Heliophilum fasciatum]
MSTQLRLDLTHAVTDTDLQLLQPNILEAHELLHSGRGAGSEFTGWLDLPSSFDREEFIRIQNAAARIRCAADVLIVIGIGGSYLGTRATLELLSHSFHNQLPRDRRPGTAVYFAGHQLSPTYLNDLIDIIGDKDVVINVISKSGTTTEPAIAFRHLRQWMEQKYGQAEARRRIYATTDRARGALKQLADDEGYETFVVPDDIGGRYSVLTAVGLLPIAAAGIDINALMAGAADAMNAYREPSLASNACYRYAAARQHLYRQGKSIEVLAAYEPGTQYLVEWWKQLYGESEGKDNKGLFPASLQLTTDLHSMGQYIQDGLRQLFETVLTFDRPRRDLQIPRVESDGDGLNFLAGQSMHYVNERAMAGTLLAHVDGGVPNIHIALPEPDAYNLGHLFYFFEKACAISGYMLGVNPFDQPGVESYKKNMFALLGKPGYEAAKAELEKRLQR